MRTNLVRAAVATAALALAGMAAAAPPPQFDGPTINNPHAPPDFALRDQQHRLVRLSALRGKVVLLTFLYTHCKDVCPLTAERLNGSLRLIGAERSQVRILAVSVDPKGDTPGSVSLFIHTHRLLPSSATSRAAAPLSARSGTPTASNRPPRPAQASTTPSTRSSSTATDADASSTTRPRTRRT